MTRTRDKLAIWLGLRGRSPKRNKSHDHVSRRKRPAETGAQAASSSVDTETEIATAPDARPESSQAPETGQDTDQGLQDKAPQSVWQIVWDSLSHSDQLLIETVAQGPDGGENVFSDLERIAHQRKQDLHDRNWTEKSQAAGKDPVRVRAAISKIIICLRRFKEVGDIAINFDPIHAALPWAAFRFVLEVSIISLEAQDDLSLLIKTICRL